MLICRLLTHIMQFVGNLSYETFNIIYIRSKF